MKSKVVLSVMTDERKSLQTWKDLNEANKS